MKRNAGGFTVVVVILIVVLALTALGFAGFTAYQTNTAQRNQPTQENDEEDAPPSITQGLKGKITLRSGNCMPTAQPHRNSCKVETYGVPTTVIIKKPINLSDKENKVVVKKLDAIKGSFGVELPVGLYNMYVIFEGKEYCNLVGGGRGEDCEFSVKADQVTSYTLQINQAVD